MSEAEEKPKYVSKGTYGCVFRPMASCKSNTKGTKSIGDPKNYISKVFYKEKSSKEEWNEFHTFLHQLDPKGDFTLAPVEHCNVTISTIPRSEFDRCGPKWASLTTPNVPQIIYPYGGIDLQGINVPYKDLMIALTRVLRGLLRMKHAEIIHQDIKLTNIVYNHSTHRAYLIDFGLALAFKDVLQKKNTFLLEAIYQILPPEYSLINALLSRSVKSLATLHTRPDYIINIGSTNPKRANIDIFIGTIKSLYPSHGPIAETLRVTSVESRKQIVDAFNRLYDTVKDVQKVVDKKTILTQFINDKVDIYSFGLCILDLCIYLLPDFVATHPNKRVCGEFVKALLHWIQGVTNFNMFERWTVRKAIDEWDKMMLLLDPTYVRPPIPSSPRKTSPASASASPIHIPTSPDPIADRPASPKLTAKPCPPGMTRHPVTKRCRKVVACKDDEEINPSTGKCRKKCKDDQERDPTTGRCRKKAKAAKAAGGLSKGTRSIQSSRRVA